MSKEGGAPDISVHCEEPRSCNGANLGKHKRRSLSALIIDCS